MKKMICKKEKSALGGAVKRLGMACLFVLGVWCMAGCDKDNKPEVLEEEPEPVIEGIAASGPKRVAEEFIECIIAGKDSYYLFSSKVSMTKVQQGIAAYKEKAVYNVMGLIDESSNSKEIKIYFGAGYLLSNNQTAYSIRDIAIIEGLGTFAVKTGIIYLIVEHNTKTQTYYIIDFYGGAYKE
jgi:hypothetical protein